MKTAICVHVTNAKHVKWWNNVGSKLVRFRMIDMVVENGVVTGYVFAIEGLLKHFVARKNNSFISDPEEVIFSCKN